MLSQEMKKSLKKRAHHLNPVVMVGQNGVTQRVLSEIDIALTAHELIKVKLMENDRDVREEQSQTICAEVDAEFVQSIGKMLVIYRKNEE